MPSATEDGVRDLLSVWRPGRLAARVRLFCELEDLSRRDIDGVNIVVSGLIANKRDLFAVRRPLQAGTGTAFLRNLLHFRAVWFHHPNFPATIAIRNKRDPLTVRRPCRVGVGGFVVGEVLRLAGGRLDEVNLPIAFLLGRHDQHTRRPGLRSGRSAEEGGGPDEHEESDVSHAGLRGRDECKSYAEDRGSRNTE